MPEGREPPGLSGLDSPLPGDSSASPDGAVAVALTPAAAADGAFSRLQQELIQLHTRLDRQVSQLMRLNHLSNRLLAGLQASEVLSTVAEAIADVLDMACGLVWVRQGPCQGTAACGLPAGATGLPDQAGLPAWLLEVLDRGRGRAVRLDPALMASRFGPELVDVLVAPCLDPAGRPLGLLLAANTRLTAGMADPVTDESLTVLDLLAEKVASHLESEQARQLITFQLGQLKLSEERMTLVLQGTNDGWWDWDLRQGSCFLSARWLDMLGEPFPEGTVREGFWLDQVAPLERADFSRALDQALAGTATSLERELRLRHSSGDYLPVLLRGIISRDSSGRALRFAGSILDLSERKRHEAAVERLAFYDPLTELPNRRLLLDRLRQALLARKRRGRALALMLLDLDHFKRLNDTHGHAAGDQLLVSVARRLVGAVRESDTVARLGGDEFVVLLEAVGEDVASARRNAEQVAHKLLSQLSEPYRIEAGVTHHSASIGLALVVDEDLTAAQVLQQADLALYQAKAQGRNTCSLYDPALLDQAEQRTTLDQNLRRALDGEALRMVYQGVVDADGRLCGCEALMRWDPAEGPAIPPADFIPVAEESGLIHELGRWSLEQVCRQVSRWRPFLSPGFRVALNVSAVQFQHPGFLQVVMDCLASSGIPGDWLRFEITEATVLPHLKFARDRMHALRGHGLEFSLDDFGTGYSSLTYLRHLPVSEVKIDRSYTQRFLADAHDRAIVQAILQLGQALGLRVVAEGVETREQWDGLRQLGCQLFQGYRFSHPTSPGLDPVQLLVGR